MPRITGSYPRDQDLLIDGAVDAGIFASQSGALREFVRTYFETHDTERIAAAVSLYDRERITLGEAARLAAVDRWTMRTLLREHGVELRVDPTDAAAVAAEIAASTDLELPTENVDNGPQSD
jgi:predicted HTH domain antitoxin